jgi:hypothetical protein
MEVFLVGGWGKERERETMKRTSSHKSFLYKRHWPNLEIGLQTEVTSYITLGGIY